MPTTSLSRSRSAHGSAALLSRRADTTRCLTKPAAHCTPAATARHRWSWPRGCGGLFVVCAAFLWACAAPEGLQLRDPDKADCADSDEGEPGADCTLSCGSAGVYVCEDASLVCRATSDGPCCEDTDCTGAQQCLTANLNAAQTTTQPDSETDSQEASRTCQASAGGTGGDGEPAMCSGPGAGTAGVLTSGDPCQQPADSYGCVLPGLWACQASASDVLVGSCLPDPTTSSTAQAAETGASSPDASLPDNSSPTPTAGSCFSDQLPVCPTGLTDAANSGDPQDAATSGDPQDAATSGDSQDAATSGDSQDAATSGDPQDAATSTTDDACGDCALPGAACGPPDNNHCHYACPDSNTQLTCVDQAGNPIGGDFSAEVCGNDTDDNCDGLTDRLLPDPDDSATAAELTVGSCCVGEGCEGDCASASPQACCTTADCQGPCVAYSADGKTVQVVPCQCSTEDDSNETDSDAETAAQAATADGQGYCYPKCGNGNLDPGEECDPSVPGTDFRLCSPKCTKQALFVPCTQSQAILPGATVNELRTVCDALQNELSTSPTPQVCTLLAPDGNGSGRSFCLPISDTPNSACPSMATSLNATTTEVNGHYTCGLDCDNTSQESNSCPEGLHCIVHPDRPTTRLCATFSDNN